MSDTTTQNASVSFAQATGRIDPCEELRQSRRAIRALGVLLEGRHVRVDVGADSVVQKYDGQIGTVTGLRPAWDIAECGYLVYVDVSSGHPIVCEPTELIPAEAGEDGSS